MLMRFDPFREMDRIAQMASEAAQTPRSFPLDAYRRGDSFILQFDLPGVNASSIDLTVERNVLTVKGERRFARRDGDEIVVAERPQGVFTRQLILGDTLDGDAMSASYDDGVLTLEIPVAEQAKPHKIEIASRGSSQTIDAHANGQTNGGDESQSQSQSQEARSETGAGVS